jgi:hypothetical protein
MKNFDYWKKLHDGNDLAEFNRDSVGQLWLKVKSITRKELLSEFTEKFSLNLTSTRLIEQFEELFLLLQIDPFRAHQKLDIYIREKNTQQLQSGSSGIVMQWTGVIRDETLIETDITAIFVNCLRSEAN